MKYLILSIILGFSTLASYGDVKIENYDKKISQQKARLNQFEQHMSKIKELQQAQISYYQNKISTATPAAKKIWENGLAKLLSEQGTGYSKLISNAQSNIDKIQQELTELNNQKMMYLASKEKTSVVAASTSKVPVVALTSVAEKVEQQLEEKKVQSTAETEKANSTQRSIASVEVADQKAVEKVEEKVSIEDPIENFTDRLAKAKSQITVDALLKEMSRFEGDEIEKEVLKLMDRRIFLSIFSGLRLYASNQEMLDAIKGITVGDYKRASSEDIAQYKLNDNGFAVYETKIKLEGVGAQWRVLFTLADNFSGRNMPHLRMVCYLPSGSSDCLSFNSKWTSLRFNLHDLFKFVTSLFSNIDFSKSSQTGKMQGFKIVKEGQMRSSDTSKDWFSGALHEVDFEKCNIFYLGGMKENGGWHTKMYSAWNPCASKTVSKNNISNYSNLIFLNKVFKE